jgi:hypothetical protein
MTRQKQHDSRGGKKQSVAKAEKGFSARHLFQPLEVIDYLELARGHPCSCSQN